MVEVSSKSLRHIGDTSSHRRAVAGIVHAAPETGDTARLQSLCAGD